MRMTCSKETDLGPLFSRRSSPCRFLFSGVCKVFSSCLFLVLTRPIQDINLKEPTFIVKTVHNGQALQSISRSLHPPPQFPLRRFPVLPLRAPKRLLHFPRPPSTIPFSSSASSSYDSMDSYTSDVAAIRTQIKSLTLTKPLIPPPANAHFALTQPSTSR